MRGLIIWACTNCRSVMELYREIKRQLNVPVKIALYVCTNGGMRPEIGFRRGEFEDMETVFVGENFNAGIKLMDQCRGYNHIFTIFQRAPTYYRLILEAQRRGEPIGIAAESPCNMSSGIKWIAKEVYNRWYLPVYAKRVIEASDFFINYSGADSKTAEMLGWNPSKIAPFGYFPPPLENSRHVKRRMCGTTDFTILSTGQLSRYRGADVLVEALQILSEKGVNYRAVITQEGELLPSLKRRAKRHSLPIDFPGFIPMPELIHMYETCSVYVGAGRSEPWGMRLNDALNCGAPLVVSRGMGGVSLVNDYGCGIAFESGNAKDLADKLSCLALDKDLYNGIAEKAFFAWNRIAPREKAKEFIRVLADKWR